MYDRQNGRSLDRSDFAMRRIVTEDDEDYEMGLAEPHVKTRRLINGMLRTL